MKASWKRGRICLIAWLEESGHVRFVNRTIASWRSGSHHNDVPVNPRCPKDDAEKYRPELEGGVGRSHPRARVVPGCWRVNSATVSDFRMGAPPDSQHWAKIATSRAVEKTPACPATPFITHAFSSCTS